MSFGFISCQFLKRKYYPAPQQTTKFAEATGKSSNVKLKGGIAPCGSDEAVRGG